MGCENVIITRKLYDGRNKVMDFKEHIIEKIVKLTELERETVENSIDMRI